MKRYNVAVVGATGLVGRTFLRVLEERNLPVDNYYLFASKRSDGKQMDFMGKTYTVRELTETSFDGLGVDIALFSAGATVSRNFAQAAVRAGAVVIDNSSCWRMEDDIPLVVPEVNGDHIKMYKNRGIISNPNCSTIQAVVVLKPLLDAFGIKRVVYSTYQAVSGAGRNGYTDLERGLHGEEPQKFPHQIANNCLPHIDVFLDTGYTKEEQKMIDETRKILSVPDMRVTATTVRVPVFHGHSESLNVELERPFELSELRKVLKDAPGLVVQDDPENGLYPMPVAVAGKDEVYVGRIRRDFSIDNGVNLWCVADNIRKGAATNTVQIAEALIKFWENE